MACRTVCRIMYSFDTSNSDEERADSSEQGSKMWEECVIFAARRDRFFEGRRASNAFLNQWPMDSWTTTWK